MAKYQKILRETTDIAFELTTPVKDFDSSILTRRYYQIGVQSAMEFGLIKQQDIMDEMVPPSRKTFSGDGTEIVDSIKSALNINGVSAVPGARPLLGAKISQSAPSLPEATSICYGDVNGATTVYTPTPLCEESSSASGLSSSDASTIVPSFSTCAMNPSNESFTRNLTIFMPKEDSSVTDSAVSSDLSHTSSTASDKRCSPNEHIGLYCSQGNVECCFDCRSERPERCGNKPLCDTLATKMKHFNMVRRNFENIMSSSRRSALTASLEKACSRHPTQTVNLFCPHHKVDLCGTCRRERHLICAVKCLTEEFTDRLNQMKEEHYNDLREKCNQLNFQYQILIAVTRDVA